MKLTTDHSSINLQHRLKMISKLLTLGSFALCADRKLAYRTNIDNEHFYFGEVRRASKKKQRIKCEALLVVRHTSEFPRNFFLLFSTCITLSHGDKVFFPPTTLICLISDF